MADEAINISTLLLDNLGSDSEESDDDPTNHKSKNEKRVRKRMKRAPLSFRNDPVGEMTELSPRSTEISD